MGVRPDATWGGNGADDLNTGLEEGEHGYPTTPATPTMFALFEAGSQRNANGLKPQVTSLRSSPGANHVQPLRGCFNHFTSFGVRQTIVRRSTNNRSAFDKQSFGVRKQMTFLLNRGANQPSWRGDTSEKES